MGGVRKAFLELAGEPVLLHALRPFLAHPGVVAVAVAVAADVAADPPPWLPGVDPRVRVVRGGDTRAESVARAVEALPGDVDLIAVHDAARPLLTLRTVEECIRAASGGEGAVAGCPAVDTVKEVDESGRITGTPRRDRLWYAHTPQVFPAAILRDAYAGAGRQATDDAALVELRGGVVRMVDTGEPNFKVTRPEDVPLAEAVLRARAAGGTG